MTEVDWGSEANEAPKAKRRVPVWAWFCGGGCLLAIIAAVAIGAFLVRQAKSMVDHERQAEELRQELPFDELPPGTRVIGTGAFASFMPGIDDMWQIPISGDSTVQIQKFTPKASVELRENIRSGELGEDAKQRIGPIGVFEIEHGVAKIQGRDVPWLRFQTYDPADVSEPAESEQEEEKKGWRKAMEEASKAFKQRLMMVDLTREGARGALIVQFQYLGAGPPVDVADVEKFLEPFHVGPER